MGDVWVYLCGIALHILVVVLVITDGEADV
jgi:hypothetical protein